jgi:hypothetical protein
MGSPSWPLGRLVHAYCALADHCAIESGDCAAHRVFSAHLNERKALALPSIAIHYHAHINDIAIGFEQLR